MELIHQAVELIEKVLAFLLQIFDLLQLHFVFPLGFLVTTFDGFDFGCDDV